jgi:hypothetical protein
MKIVNQKKALDYLIGGALVCVTGIVLCSIFEAGVQSGQIQGAHAEYQNMKSDMADLLIRSLDEEEHSWGRIRSLRAENKRLLQTIHGLHKQMDISEREDANGFTLTKDQQIQLLEEKVIQLQNAEPKP